MSEDTPPNPCDCGTGDWEKITSELPARPGWGHGYECSNCGFIVRQRTDAGSADHGWRSYDPDDENPVQ